MARDKTKGSSPDFALEAALMDAGTIPVCGIDEAGRGPWAGPVTAAAVILAPNAIPPGINDSKAMTHDQRAEVARAIRATAQAFCVAHASVAEIDDLNILAATMLAMRRACDGLGIKPAHALVDGNRAPKLACAVTTVVKGDGRALSIAAASILAKVARDDIMTALDHEHPGYGFSRHKGYGTAAHQAALRRLGPSPAHRLSFAPIRALVTQDMD